MPRFPTASLRTRLLLLILLGLIPTVALMVSLHLEQRRQATSEVQANTLRLARVAAGNQARLLEGAHQLLLTLSQLPPVRAADPAACSRLLAQFLPQYPHYTNLGVVRPDGEIACSALPLSQPVNVADRAYVQRALRQRTFAVGEYQTGRVSGKASLNFGYPMLDAAGQPQGVVYAALDLVKFNDVAAEAQLPPGAVLAVIDRTGRILSRFPAPDDWVGRSFPEVPLVQTILSQQEGAAELPDLDGVPRFYAFVPVGGPAERGLYVAFGIDRQAALAEADRQFSRALLLAGVISALVLATAWVGSDRLILQRVRVLVQATQRLSAGDLQVRTGLAYGQEEVSQLARAFDTLATQLQRRQAEATQAETALRKSEELYRTLARNVPNGSAFLFDHDLRFTLAEGSGLATVGPSKEFLEGKTLWEAFPPETCAQLEPMYRAALAGTASTGEVPYADHIYLVQALPVTNQRGEISAGMVMTQDITDHQRTEAALRESQALFQSFMNNSPAVAFMKDEDGRIVYVNAPFERLFGLTRADWEGKTEADFWPAETAARLRANDLAVLAGDQVVELLEELPHADGPHSWLTYKFPLVDPAGRRLLAGMTIDITARVRAEAALAQSEQALRALIDHALDAILVADDDGVYVDVNPAACALFGLPRAALLGRHLAEFARPGSEPAARADWRSLLDQGQRAGTFEVHRPDGTIRLTEYAARAHVLPGRHLAVLRDITARRQAEQALRESADIFDALFNATTEGMVIHVQDTLLAANQAFADMVGCATAAEVVGKQALDFVAPESHPLVISNIQAGHDRPYEIVAVRTDGAVFPVELTSKAIRYQGHPARLTTIRDITERQRAEAAQRFLAEASRVLGSSLDYATTLRAVAQLAVPAFTDLTTVYLDNGDGTLNLMAIAGANAEHVAVLEAARRRYPLDGQSPHPVARVVREGQAVFWPEVTPALLDVIAPEPGHRSAFEALGVTSSIVMPLVARGRILGAMSWAMSASRRHYTPADLELAEELARRAALAIDNARLYQEAREELEERKRLEAQLTHQAFHDPLTRLANRALVYDRIAHALARTARHQTPLAVLLLDLDGFKTINDSLGHAAGDQLLVTVAERLTDCLRSTDTVARLGGDEFAILLEDLADRQEAVAVAERILESLCAALSLSGKDVTISTSIGIAVTASGAESTDDLIRDADLALYSAKRQGKNRAQLFAPHMHAAALERLELEAELRRAVQQQEFSLVYQPIVAVAGNQIIGLEALLRWQHPQRGFVSPAEFIPVAEETGLIVPLSQWVLRQACRQARRWQMQSPAAANLRIGVNLSPRYAQSPGLVADVAQALQAAGLDPRCLVLEITESVMMQETATTIDTLQALRTLGVRLAMDDFGTGYSSLGYLQRFPLDSLKIDRAFVSRLGHDAEADAIVQAIITLAHTLNLQVTGEGIETAEQRDALLRLGCDHGQGYYFARPMEPAAVDRLLAGVSVARVSAA